MLSAALSGKPREESFRGRSENSFPEQRLVTEPTIQIEHTKMSSFVKKGHIKGIGIQWDERQVNRSPCITAHSDHGDSNGNVKKSNRFNEQNNNSARESRFFVNLFAVPAQL